MTALRSSVRQRPGAPAVVGERDHVAVRVPRRAVIAERSIGERHRSASQLELLFDLTFVIAIARLTIEFAHGIVDGRGIAANIESYLLVFFCVWWAWMNFTWFASAFDNDDAVFRALTMVQMAGVLILAAGVPAAFESGDYRAISVGFVLMRVGLVALWLRVARGCTSSRAMARRSAAGLAALQLAWVLWLTLIAAVDVGRYVPTALFVVLAAAEVSVPWWVERPEHVSASPWHPHHIAERYGLFTIILLGESLLAASLGVQGAIAEGGAGVDLLIVAASGFVLTMSLWWLYFLDRPGIGLDARRHRAYRWGYAHFAIFAALGALGAGVEVAAEQTAHHVGLSGVVVAHAVAVPVAVFLLGLAAVTSSLWRRPSVSPVSTGIAAAAVLASPWLTLVVPTPAAVGAIALTCAALVWHSAIDHVPASVPGVVPEAASVGPATVAATVRRRTT